MSRRPSLLRNRSEPPSPEQIQREFYAETASRYDEQFLDDGREPYHGVALDFMSALIDGYGYESALDVGAGTGRVARHLIDRHPGLDIRGIEPVPELISVAERNGVPPGTIMPGDGRQLPFEDESFDAVCEVAVLHHVADPAPIVAEMTRVARRAVFMSDTNRFGQGRTLARYAKYALHGAGLWGLAHRLRTGGRPYILNDFDGRVAYSYSVYDSFRAIDAWADRAFFVPLEPGRTTRFHPLFGVKHLLLVGLRDALI